MVDRYDVGPHTRRADNEIPSPAWALDMLSKNRSTNFTGTELEHMMSQAPGDQDREPARGDTDPYTGFGLTETEEAVIDCTVIAGLTFRQTSGILGIPVTSVHRIHHATLKRIKSLMEEQ